MPVYDVELSVAGINDVIWHLNDFRQSLERAEHEIVSMLANDAAADMQASLSAVTDPDGNIDAQIDPPQVTGNEAVVSMSGSQAAYLEFGTGVVGARNPHELSAQVGWQYGAGSHYRTFRNGRVGWVYFDRSRNHYRVTSGITPQRIVLRAGQTTRMRVLARAREALR